MPRGEEEIVELVNAVVDGEATAEEQAELEHMLATSQQARDLFDSTREIARRLEAMRSFDPPAELRGAIIEKLMWRRASARRVPAEAGTHIRRRVFTLAWAAAAALVLVFLLVGHRPMTDTNATMAPAWPIVQQIKSPGATLIVRRHGDLYELNAVAAGSPVSISWDDSKLTRIGISDKKDASSGKASSKVIVRPRDGASAAEVRVSVGTEEVLRAVVALR